MSDSEILDWVASKLHHKEDFNLTQEDLNLHVLKYIEDPGFQQSDESYKKVYRLALRDYLNYLISYETAQGLIHE